MHIPVRDGPFYRAVGSGENRQIRPGTFRQKSGGFPAGKPQSAVAVVEMPECRVSMAFSPAGRHPVDHHEVIMRAAVQYGAEHRLRFFLVAESGIARHHVEIRIGIQTDQLSDRFAVIRIRRHCSPTQLFIRSPQKQLIAVINANGIGGERGAVVGVINGTPVTGGMRRHDKIFPVGTEIHGIALRTLMRIVHPCRPGGIEG